MNARHLIAFTLAAGMIGGAGYMIAHTDFEGQAKKAVENQGMTDVKTDFSLVASILKCGKDDLMGYDFTAKNPQGNPVSGYVCTGLFKGSTVRW